MGAAGECEPLADLDGAERVVARAELHDPVVLGIAILRRRRESKLEHCAIGACNRQRGGERGGRVDDDEIAGAEEPRQLGEAAVEDDAGGAIADEQAHVVAAPSARLRRLVRLEPPRQLERERGHTATSAMSLAR